MAIQIGIESPTIDVTATQRQVGALETTQIEQFQTIRSLGGSADATFSFGPRASRPSAGAQGDRYYATDIGARGGYLYYYSGTVWELLVGVATGTDAQRSGYTPDATDDGGIFWTTDTNKLWEVSGGAWVDRFVSLDATTSYEVGGTKVLGARNTGWTAWVGTGSKASFDTATATLTNNNEATKAIIDALIAHGILGA